MMAGGQGPTLSTSTSAEAAAPATPRVTAQVTTTQEPCALPPAAGGPDTASEATGGGPPPVVLLLDDDLRELCDVVRMAIIIDHR
jgi:hypothetical protein